MPAIHRAALAHELRRWMRPDAHRFIGLGWRRLLKPGSEAAALFSRYEAKYRPDQPRVPAGVREGGQWTTDGGGAGSSHRSSGDAGSASKPSDISTPGLVMSDATPDPIRPGTQYAQLTGIEYRTSGITGIQAIDETTVKLSNTLARVMDAVKYSPDLNPALYGTEVHTAFAAAVRLQQIPGVEVEPTFGPYYGAKGSLRPDAILRNDGGDVIAIYDVKTGDQEIDAVRAARLRLAAGVENDVPVIEMRIRHIVLRKAMPAYTSSALALDVKLTGASHVDGIARPVRSAVDVNRGLAARHRQ